MNRELCLRCVHRNGPGKAHCLCWGPEPKSCDLVEVAPTLRTRLRALSPGQLVPALLALVLATRSGS